jgi:hypothetical protein
MADTGEDREIRSRAEAHEAEVIRESKKSVAKVKQPYDDSKARKKASGAKPSRPRTGPAK